MKKIIRYSHLFVRKILKNNFPLWILINITNKCPYSCKYCNIPPEKSLQTPTDIFFRLIDSCEKIGIKFITLTGGEPLIRNDIIDLITYIKNKNFYLRLSTEGVKDIEKMKALKKVDLANLSFDGPQAIHDRQRFNGSFQNLMNNIDFLKKEGINFRAICVLTKNNMGHIDYILDFAKDKKFDVFFQPISNTYFYRGNVPAWLTLEKEEIIKAAKLLIKKKKTNKYLANSLTMLNHLSGNNKFRYRCHAKIFFIYAHCDSKIYHCWVNPTTPLGDITKEGLGQILKKDFRYDYANCECNSYSCVEKNCLIDLNPFCYYKSKYL